MKIQLYKNKYYNIYINKDIEFINEVDGYFRFDTTLLEPSIEIEISDYNSLEYYLDIVTFGGDDIAYLDDSTEIDVDAYVSDNIFNVNYIYIEEFKRYYYVNNIDIVSNKIFRFNCSVDTLMSHKEDILNLDALVSRNEYTYDDTIEDTLAPYEYMLDVEESDVDISTADLTFNPSMNDYYNVYENYVISYLTQGGLDYSRRVIESPNPVLPDVSDTTKGFNNCNRLSVMSLSYVKSLATYLIDHESDATFIMSLVAYPFEIPAYSTIGSLRLGKKQISSVMVHDIISAVSPYYKIGSFRINYENYNSIEPYTKYELFLPYYGYVELKSSDIINSNIEIYYSFDYANGSAKINVINASKNYVIKSVTAQIGIIIPLSRTNNQQLNDEKSQLAIKTSIGVLGSMISMVGGVASSNPFLVANAVAGLTSTIADTSVQLAQMHEKASVSNANGSEGLYGCQIPRIKKTKYIRKNVLDYSKYYGKPLNQRYKLSDLSGYTIVKEIRLNNVTATDTEKADIDSLLKNGIVL